MASVLKWLGDSGLPSDVAGGIVLFLLTSAATLGGLVAWHCIGLLGSGIKRYHWDLLGYFSRCDTLRGAIDAGFGEGAITRQLTVTDLDKPLIFGVQPKLDVRLDDIAIRFKRQNAIGYLVDDADVDGPEIIKVKMGSMKWDRHEFNLELKRDSKRGFRHTYVRDDGPVLKVDNQLWFEIELSRGIKQWNGGVSVKCGAHGKKPFRVQRRFVIRNERLLRPSTAHTA